MISRIHFKRRAVALAAFLAVSIGMMGCTSSEETRAAEENMPRDISWLTLQLQDDGIVVRERGEAALVVSAQLSRRLLLNGREVVDAYLYNDKEKARNQADIFAGSISGASVYVQGNLVVVRHSDLMSEVSTALHRHLGVIV